MNEHQTAYAIGRQLDQSIDKLPDRVTGRLSQARSQALAQLTDERTAARARPLDFDTPSFLSRAALAVVPLAVITAGLIGLAQWNNDQRVQELAELDTQVVLDDLPLAALTDNGFGVFLQNTRR